MNDIEFLEYLEQMKKFTEKVKADKKLSLELLIRAGICDKNGQLEAIYK